MGNVERALRIPRSWMESDADFAAECDRPHRPTPPCRPQCPNGSHDFRTRFDDVNFLEDEIEEAVSFSDGCGCHPEPPVCPPSCGCDCDCDEEPDDCGCDHHDCGCDHHDCGCQKDPDLDEDCGHQNDCRNRSLAMPYVIRQRWTGKREIYNRPRALLRGTLFVELDKPFTGKGGSRDE
ncbi:spore coat associated protein CotJA [Holdemania massiliensis]|uniref:spore coat associated protein CotJA n=1 Tax=Holdemania massiliensis TaxID=1468449 RepID=UPI0019D580EC|nr:spore coat associated protein CotJA [Holdemania massiliensis]